MFPYCHGAATIPGGHHHHQNAGDHHYHRFDACQLENTRLRPLRPVRRYLHLLLTQWKDLENWVPIQLTRKR